MAINSDVKLFESQRLTDEEDGGSRVTGSEVLDYNVNNLFHSIPQSFLLDFHAHCKSKMSGLPADFIPS